MATIQDIQTVVELINNQWNKPTVRNDLFGNILKSIAIQNIRAINNTIELTWPVIAIGGINGSGKTTILQICSTAYSKQVGGRYYSLGDWIRTGLKEETPAIKEPAIVTFSFWNETPSLEVYYTSKRSRWEYPRRKKAERHVEFIGIGNFAPRIEKRDRVHAFRSSLEIKTSKDIDFKILQSISRVLGIAYDEAKVYSVGTSTGQWTDTLPAIKRGSTIYTEPHMGAGEQKIVRLIQFLESLPKKSLILLEEPEIILHPDAQRGLAWYLMTLSLRQGHQIIIATHSTEIFEVLPEQARILLLRDGKGVEALHKAPYLRAARELSSSIKTNKNIILVEDTVGQAFLTEILRKYDMSLLEQSCIVPIGNTDDVQRMVNSFRKQGFRAIGVRDPDIGENTNQGLFSLPGSKAPETLLLDLENIVRAESYVNGIKDAFERAKVQGLGLQGSQGSKKVFKALPNEAGLAPDKLADRLTLAWFSEPANNEAAKLLVERMNKCFDGN